jgi:hypothetical protein
MDETSKPVPFRTQSDDPASLADPSMLEKIDMPFACNVGNYIDLSTSDCGSWGSV